MQPEGEIALSVQVCKGIFEKGFLAVFIEVGMKEDVDEHLQSLIGNLDILHEIQDRILLMKDGIQVEREAGLSELLLDVSQGIIRGLITQEPQFSGDSHQHLTDAVNLFQDKVFHLRQFLLDNKVREKLEIIKINSDPANI